MIAIDDCFYLGKITKLFGYKGEVILFLDTDSPEIYYNIESVLLEIQGELIPFMIDNSKIKNRFNIIVSFHNFGAEEVSSLINAAAYLPLNMLPKLSGNKFYFHEVIGFQVVDKEYGTIGKVQIFYDNPGQTIMSVLNDEGIEILIPVIDKFFKSVDRKNKSIEIEAPEGLIELYISGS